MASNSVDEVVRGIKKLDITQSNRNKPILIYENFEFKIEASKDQKTRWRCNTTNGTCPARLWRCPVQHVLFDGTFGVVKDIPGIYQMVSLHILIKGTSLPLIYAFLPKKNRGRIS